MTPDKEKTCQNNGSRVVARSEIRRVVYRLFFGSSRQIGVFDVHTGSKERGHRGGYERKCQSQSQVLVMVPAADRSMTYPAWPETSFRGETLCKMVRKRGEFEVRRTLMQEEEEK